MTKSKGIGRGGRRKGAGRPRFSKTGKTEFFTTRITPKTRHLLEAEARRCGESLSVVAEGMLLTGLEKRSEVQRRSYKLRALFFLIERLAVMVRGGYGRGPSSGKGDARYKYNWVNDPYMFEAFRVGVMGILERLRPSGDVVKPPGDPLFVEIRIGDNSKHDLRRYAFPNTPAEWGNLCAYDLLLSASYQHTLSEIFQKLGEAVPMPRGARTHYGLIDAGRDLGLSRDLSLSREELNALSRDLLDIRGRKNERTPSGAPRIRAH
jgi:hypothetical protein